MAKPPDNTPPPNSRGTFWSRLFAPVDIASLVYFRIVFGAIMFWEVWHFLSHGLVKYDYIDPKFYFSYYGFDWIRPWPGEGMYLHFFALGALAIYIMLGLWYRISTTLFFLGFTYVFLIDQTHYLNHFYLLSLISLLLTFVPAHRAFSIDVLRRPGLHRDTAPAWTLWLLRAQIGIVYFYGGLAKLNGDWFRGEPMRMWMARTTDFPIIGPLFTTEWTIFLFSYGGLLFDLLIVPLLLWRRTRAYAFAAAVVFHLINARLFNIGVFPWFMIAATLLFFPPHWPRLGRLGAALESRKHPEQTHTPRLRSGQRATIGLLGVYLALQLLVPLRHYLYPGNVIWTEEGQHFAWHMMLRQKRAGVAFFATDPIQNLTWRVSPLRYLTLRQLGEMSGRPDMILQFSHHIAHELHKRGYEQIEIRATAVASLNGRKPQFLIDPTVNLAAQQRTLRSASWIQPLEVPLSDQLQPRPDTKDRQAGRDR